MLPFAKYWARARSKNVLNKFFNTRASVKHSCSLAFLAGVRFGRYKTGMYAWEEYRVSCDQLKEREKNMRISELENDAFQTALTETFTEEEVTKFFDKHDEIIARNQNEKTASR